MALHGVLQTSLHAGRLTQRVPEVRLQRSHRQVPPAPTLEHAVASRPAAQKVAPVPHKCSGPLFCLNGAPREGKHQRSMGPNRHVHVQKPLSRAADSAPVLNQLVDIAAFAFANTATVLGRLAIPLIQGGDDLERSWPRASSQIRPLHRQRRLPVFFFYHAEHPRGRHKVKVVASVRAALAVTTHPANHEMGEFSKKFFDVLAPYQLFKRPRLKALHDDIRVAEELFHFPRRRRVAKR
mmetsp:Transcript_77124/g.151061  ORF Transcript_77124/g.151061 Transcript_77124/m.151061 type:complete len:238 (-) Transcript_77124:306-1019(-)